MNQTVWVSTCNLYIKFLKLLAINSQFPLSFLLSLFRFFATKSIRFNTKLTRKKKTKNNDPCYSVAVSNRKGPWPEILSGSLTRCCRLSVAGAEATAASAASGEGRRTPCGRPCDAQLLFRTSFYVCLERVPISNYRERRVRSSSTSPHRWANMVGLRQGISFACFCFCFFFVSFLFLFFCFVLFVVCFF